MIEKYWSSGGSQVIPDELRTIPTAQFDEQRFMFHRLIERFQIATFIELGTFKGGLAYEMILTHPEMKVHSFDHDVAQLHPLVRGIPEIYIRDVFHKDTVAFVSSIINASDGPVLLFCDNGNKVKEFYLYYPLLRVGDFIQVHDYPVEATPELVKDVSEHYLDLEPIDLNYYLANYTVCWKKVALGA